MLYCMFFPAATSCSNNEKPACTSCCYFLSHWPPVSKCGGLIIASILCKLMSTSFYFYSWTFMNVSVQSFPSLPQRYYFVYLLYIRMPFYTCCFQVPQLPKLSLLYIFAHYILVLRLCISVSLPEYLVAGNCC